MCISVTHDFPVASCACHPKSNDLIDERINGGISILLNTTHQ